MGELGLIFEHTVAMINLVAAENAKMLQYHDDVRPRDHTTSFEWLDDFVATPRPGLITDIVTANELQLGRSFLKFMGLNDIAERLDCYQGIATTSYSVPLNHFVEDGWQSLIPHINVGCREDLLVMHKADKERQAKQPRAMSAGELLVRMDAPPRTVNPRHIDPACHEERNPEALGQWVSPEKLAKCLYMTNYMVRMPDGKGYSLLDKSDWPEQVADEMLRRTLRQNPVLAAKYVTLEGFCFADPGVKQDAEPKDASEVEDLVLDDLVNLMEVDDPLTAQDENTAMPEPVGGEIQGQKVSDADQSANDGIERPIDEMSPERPRREESERPREKTRDILMDPALIPPTVQPRSPTVVALTEKCLEKFRHLIQDDTPKGNKITDKAPSASPLQKRKKKVVFTIGNDDEDDDDEFTDSPAKPRKASDLDDRPWRGSGVRKRPNPDGSLPAQPPPPAKKARKSIGATRTPNPAAVAAPGSAAVITPAPVPEKPPSRRKSEPQPSRRKSIDNSEAKRPRGRPRKKPLPDPASAAPVVPPAVPNAPMAIPAAASNTPAAAPTTGVATLSVPPAPPTTPARPATPPPTAIDDENIYDASPVRPRALSSFIPAAPQDTAVQPLVTASVPLVVPAQAANTPAATPTAPVESVGTGRGTPAAPLVRLGTPVTPTNAVPLPPAAPGGSRSSTTGALHFPTADISPGTPKMSRGGLSAVSASAQASQQLLDSKQIQAQTDQSLQVIQQPQVIQKPQMLQQPQIGHSPRTIQRLVRESWQPQYPNIMFGVPSEGGQLAQPNVAVQQPILPLPQPPMTTSQPNIAMGQPALNGPRPSLPILPPTVPAGPPAKKVAAPRKRKSRASDPASEQAKPAKKPRTRKRKDEGTASQPAPTPQYTPVPLPVPFGYNPPAAPMIPSQVPAAPQTWNGGGTQSVVPLASANTMRRHSNRPILPAPPPQAAPAAPLVSYPPMPGLSWPGSATASIPTTQVQFTPVQASVPFSPVPAPAPSQPRRPTGGKPPLEDILRYQNIGFSDGADAKSADNDGDDYVQANREAEKEQGGEEEEEGDQAFFSSPGGLRPWKAKDPDPWMARG